MLAGRMTTTTATPPSRDPPALASLSATLRGRMGELGPLMRGKALYPVFQPIASLDDGSVYAHEALVRGPAGTPMHSADALFRLARESEVLIEFELYCVELALAHWGRMNQHHAQQYFKEIFGQRSCSLHANHAPRLVERDCERIVREFRTLALSLFDDSARAAGGIEAEDRNGA